ncbi:MAG: hypothetical protein WBH31_16600 [Promethearchaeia archaeon]
MMETIKFNNDLSKEAKVIQIFNRAVTLFKKTGLIDLAEKWNKILKTYMNRENLKQIALKTS